MTPDFIPSYLDLVFHINRVSRVRFEVKFIIIMSHYDFIVKLKNPGLEACFAHTYEVQDKAERSEAVN